MASLGSSSSAAQPQVRSESEAPTSGIGAKELIHGDKLGLRIWEGDVGSSVDDSQLKRDYVQSHESVGYMISGKVQLAIEGQTLILEPGQSWLVPRGAHHSYKILEGPMKAVEVCGPRHDPVSGSRV
jgi:quercetin dioxygenase-like cupin family protein